LSYIYRRVFPNRLSETGISATKNDDTQFRNAADKR